MKKIFILLLFLFLDAFGLEGPDYMLSVDLYYPDSKSFSIASVPNGNKQIGAIFQNASLYGIGSLKWTFVGARICLNSSILGVTFRDYGINNLYTSTSYSFFLNKVVLSNTFLGFGYSRQVNNYGDGFVETSSDKFSIIAGREFNNFSISTVLDNITSQNKNYNNNLEFITAAKWQANEILNLCGSYYYDNHGNGRFSIGQKLEISKLLLLKTGIFTVPEIYYAGFEIVYKQFVLGYTFYDTGGLPDCSRITLSYR